MGCIMATCPDPTDIQNQSIAQALASIGPRTVEGDQGRVTMHSVSDAIKAIEHGRTGNKMKNRKGIQSVLRTISNNRLLTHDGPAS
jgi:hypothetical protein